MTIANVEKILSGEDQWSTEVWLVKNFNFSLSGTWIATVHVQRYFKLLPDQDPDVIEIIKDWKDVEAFTSPGAYVGEEPEGAFYRFGIKEGNHTSGEIEGRLSQ